MRLPHENLIAYEKALQFVLSVAPVLDSWPRELVLYDQMDRACDSLLINLVTAAGQSYSDEGIYHLDCSLGSALECAACLDIAAIKQLIDTPSLQTWKESLQTVVRVEIGLRKAWNASVQEEPEEYVATPGVFFTHESLKVYQSALQLCKSLESGDQVTDTHWHRYSWKADKAVTSLILNIAEGNGRFSKLDHRKFITIAQESGSKLAAYLDLSTSQHIEPIKPVLREVMAMLSGLKTYLTPKKSQIQNPKSP